MKFRPDIWRSATQPRRWRRGLVVLVALAWVASACGNSSDDATENPESEDVATVDSPGVTNDEIRFSVLGTKSNNPLGTCILDCFADGIEAYFAYRNSQGGVHGRKLLVTKEVDDEVGLNQAKALEIISADDTFATFSEPLVANGFDEFAKSRIPLYATYIQSPERDGHDTMFGNREVLCAACPYRWYPYFAKVIGAKRVASIGYGDADIARLAVEGVADSFEKYGDEVGAEVVYKKDDLQFGLPNGIAPVVTAMKKAGVDLVFPSMDLNGVMTLAAELGRQDMRDDVTILNANLYDEAFVGEADGLLEGDYVIPIFRPFEADARNSALETYFTWMKKAKADLSENAMIGWIDADLAYQGLKAAGPNFNRERVIAATNRFTHYTADGLTQPIDWTRQHDAPTPDDPITNGPKDDCAPLVRIQDSKFELVGDKAKPWFCWPGDTDKWSEPTSEDFG